MCGLVGAFGSFDQKKFDNHLQSVQPQLHRRGPDKLNAVFCEAFGAAHSRLIVRGSSADGDQPFFCKHLTVLFNGNLYNKVEIQLELERSGHSFDGLCDTEVIAVAILHWGNDAYTKFNGFFAIVVHNKLDNTITLTRDRYGQKPLYFSLTPKTIFFGSTEKMIPVYARGKIRKESYIDFVTYGFIPAPSTMYENMHLIEPATSVSFELKCNRPKLKQMNRFWNPEIVSELNTFEESFEAFSSAIRSSVFDGLMADTEIACLYSGGVDSSILFFLAKQMQNDLCAVTADFGGTDRSIERALPLINTLDHKSFLMKKISSKEVQRYLGKTNKTCESPFDDTSIIPSIAAYESVKEMGYKVAITGDGADELFCGYRSFSNLKAMSVVLNENYDGIRHIADIIVKKIVPKRYQGSNFDRYFMNSDDLLTDLSCNGFKKREWGDGIQSDYDPHHYVKKIIENYQGMESVEKFRILNLLFKLPNQMLYKVDRASMYNSVEARPLFLNDKVVDVALKTNSSVMMQGGGKSLLKEFCKRNLPPAGWSLPKDGFGWKTNNFHKIFRESDHQRIFLRTNIRSERLLDNRKINLKRGYFGLRSLSLWLKENTN